MMISFTKQRLQSLFDGFSGRRVAVIGDLMLDRYYWGNVARISPEAPVPVVDVESESTRLGGAANVANNIASLGGIPVMIGVIGSDASGAELKKIIDSQGFPSSGVVTDSTRPTTVKTRVIAHHQHVVRIDQETRHDISPEIVRKIMKTLQDQIESLDGIILEDYNKGVLVPDLIKEIIGMAKKHQKPVAVDPKFENFFAYKSVTVFKPNRKETEEALGYKMNDRATIDKAGKELLKRLRANHVLLTLGEQGMVLFEEGNAVTHLPTRAMKVADVSGAGDTVVSTLSMVLAAGGNIGEASAVANFAGGIVCGEVGIVPVDKGRLFETVLAHLNHRAD